MWDELKSNAALTLSILGAVVGVGAGILVMLVGGAGLLFAAEALRVVWLGAIAIVLSLLGIVGGGLTSDNPELATILLVIVGLGGFVALSVFWLLPGALFLIGAYAAWSSRSGQRRRTAPA